VDRVLVRHGLVAARKRKRRRQDYKRWHRVAPSEARRGTVVIN
jgi:hypothetical protein